MKAVIKSAPEKGVNIQYDFPEPVVTPGQLKVQVAAAAVCGTDRGIYEFSEAAQAFNLRLPVVMGHEGAGTVVEVGQGVTGFKVGDRVAFDSHIPCNVCYQCSIGSAHLCLNMQLLGLHVDGLFAEYCNVAPSAAYKIPDQIDFEEAALLEPAGVAMHALQSAPEPILGKRVLISGGGPVGLFIAELSRLAGAAKVVVIEPNPYRMTMAEKLGATALAPGDGVIDALHQMSRDRHGFDLGFEASGHPSSFGTLSQALRIGGAFISVGFGSSGGEFDGAEFLNRRNITYVGSFGRRLWSTWDLLTVMISEGKLELAKFITHRFGLDDFEEAMGVLSGDSCKAIILPGRS